MDARFGAQHLIDAVGRDCRTRDHDEHHAQHQEAEHDLHGILHKRQHVADLHLAVSDLVCAHPDDQHRHQVHHKHHGGEHQRYQPVDKQVRAL
ncbi:hypothetical protein SDC9_147078 [bioreactor metagenome]|uniref:Uncharacterized protein n=1 Tax=bioreactor metagenome TaxID=1076179 RepID=A0A645EGK1_9ZZZZ